MNQKPHNAKVIFSRCRTVPELDAAYEQAVAAVKSDDYSFEQAMDDLVAGRQSPPSKQEATWDALKAAHHQRWSEITGQPWSVDSMPVTSDPHWCDGSDRPDMEQ